jgi:PQQ-dependent dehydrogenase (methanol/ethanol family)
MRSLTRALVVPLALLALSGLAQAQDAPAGNPSAPGFAAAIADDAQWTLPTRDSAATRYSGLADINSDNVKQLKVAFTFSTGATRGHEAAPLVAGDTMYVLGPYPHTLYALDLTQPGAPPKWRYDPKPDASAQGVACCDVVNRGPTFDGGSLYFTTLDTHVVSVDAATGQEKWKVKLGNINQGETMTMAPLVVKGKVIVGNSGGEYGVRGWIQALDAATGKSLWKAYSTGSDQDVKIGPSFKPFYPSDQGKDLGISTWPPNAWQQGGGTVWGFVSFDPDLNLIYYGTANPGPWNPELRPGNNKWTAGVFARDLDTGEARWFYQWNPHDLFDWDGINENVLVDIDWQGQRRNALVHPDRNGLVYLLDRTNGEVLSASFYAAVNAHEGVDLKTGLPKLNQDKAPVQGRVVRNICPPAPGAKDWSPSSFSHRTGLLYIPHNNMCMDWESVEVSYIAGTPYVGAEVRMFAGPGGHMGELSAWNIGEGREVWTINERFPVWSGTLVSAGDLVFYGSMEGWFKAVHARTGELLWQFKTASGIIGQPTTYRGPDGKQYVAVLSGVGGWAGAVVAGDLDVRDGTAALGFVNAMRELPNVTTKGGTLYVFSLP